MPVIANYGWRNRREAFLKLGEEVLAGSFLDALAAQLIGDKAYDSNKLGQKLKEEYGIRDDRPERPQPGKTCPERYIASDNPNFETRWPKSSVST